VLVFVRLILHREKETWSHLGEISVTIFVVSLTAMLRQQIFHSLVEQCVISFFFTPVYCLHFDNPCPLDIGGGDV
jgi:hypothetical protein